MKKEIKPSSKQVARLAALALKAWAEYGEAMRTHGRGAECSFSATGYTNEALIQMLKGIENE